jgi:5'-nucleotidase
VTYQGATWEAMWWTQNQAPGDPNGPWEQIATAADGTAIWTPSRVFTTGDVVVYQGEKYVAKWWTRNQAPGDPNGPWQPVS